MLVLIFLSLSWGLGLSWQSHHFNRGSEETRFFSARFFSTLCRHFFPSRRVCIFEFSREVGFTPLGFIPHPSEDRRKSVKLGSGHSGIWAFRVSALPSGKVDFHAKISPIFFLAQINYQIHKSIHSVFSKNNFLFQEINPKILHIGPSSGSGR